MFHLFIIAAFWFSLVIPAYAQNGLADKLSSAKELQRQQQERLSALETDLDKTGKNLVTHAADVQKSEKTLSALDQKIAKLKMEQDALLDKLKSQENSMAKMLLALERLRRMPPQAMVLKPGKPLETAESALLLKEIMPALQKQAETLKDDLRKLSFVSEDLKVQRDKASRQNEILITEQKQLNLLVKERKRLYAALHKDIEEQEKKIRHISAQSNTLSELVSRLDNFRKKPSNLPAQARAQDMRPPPRAGSARLPVSGVVVRRFNEADDFGAPSQGIDIEGRAGAVVVAPMGGVVRFAGYFKNYGNMMILEHEQGWHSLVAGLEKIDTVVGQRVAAGEPLGQLHNTANGQKPRLYYELRQNGKPVNPSKKFSDLS